MLLPYRVVCARLQLDSNTLSLIMAVRTTHHIRQDADWSWPSVQLKLIETCQQRQFQKRLVRCSWTLPRTQFPLQTSQSGRWQLLRRIFIHGWRLLQRSQSTRMVTNGGALLTTMTLKLAEALWTRLLTCVTSGRGEGNSNRRWVAEA